LTKLRVHELAKEYDLRIEDLVRLLREMGIAVRGHTSTLDDEQAARARARLELERRRGGKIQVGSAKPAVRRRPRPKVEAAEPEAEEAAPAAEEAATAPAAPEMLPVARAAPAEPMAPAAAAVAPSPGAPEEEAPRAPAPEKAAERAAERPAAEALAPAAPSRPAPPAAPLAPAAPAAPGPAAPPPRPVRRVAPPPAASAAPGGQVRIQAEGYTVDGRRRGKRGRKKRSRVDEALAQETLKRTLAQIEGGPAKRRRREHEPEVDEAAREELERKAEEERKTIRVPEFLTVAELADLLGVNATQIIASAFKNLGLMITINQRLDFDQIELVCEEFGFKAVRADQYAAELEEVAEAERPEDLVPRPPVVTVMGHVDHGKTSLLDYIRKTNVIAGEAGGITQHIGAYHVELDGGRQITFLDTPGHAAFTAMRARGADVTDIVVLVVAADDGVMPQTVEAISHAKNAGKPIVVAVNKIDLPGAKPERVKRELLEHGVVLEEFGGDVLHSEVSAKTGQGIDDLLEKILLQAELLELKANPKRRATGTVIEAMLDRGMGPVATVLITNGTLRVGDDFVCGPYAGRVRALLDERGNAVESAGPGIPVRVLGMEGVPQAGDTLVVTEAEKAREIAQKRQQLEREKEFRRRQRALRLENVFEEVKKGARASLALILKGDTDGSVQALSDALLQLSTDEVPLQVIHRGVGAINESDVLLAATASAIVIGFHVRPDPKARELAEREGVDIRLYRVIYEAVEEMRAALEGMLKPETREVVLGTAEVRALFKVPKVGTVAGCYVTSGVIERNARVRVLRDHVEVYEGRIASLRRFKEDVREVREGFECGIAIENFNDVKVGDVIEAFRIEEVARHLAAAGERRT
jgi:translation initiation factor IF-2